ncbi:MAG TPA: amidohydrolase family protein [Steroidobacteraceae bacterium]|nr:amidohydrolase family protein [Steroidobacteraceae bacterium]
MSIFLIQPGAQIIDGRGLYFRSPEGQWFHYMAEHNARVLFGTDTPSAPTYANQPGLNGWLEMHRLIDAGLTPARVFRAATLANAEALGLSREIGAVQPGMRANLLLLREDPTQTIEAYDAIVKVILHGQVLDRMELAANSTGGNASSRQRF